MYTKIKKSGNTYVADGNAFTNPKPVTVNSIQHPKTIFRLWSDKELNAISYARVEELNRVNSQREKIVGVIDKFVNGKIQRRYSVESTGEENQKVRLISQVNGVRESKISAGINVTVANTVYQLQTDQKSRDNITRMASAINSGFKLPLTSKGNPSVNGTHLSWRMRDNTDVVMDGATFLSSIAKAVFDHVNACHFVSRAKKVEINALSTWEDINSYNINDGWPTTLENE